MSLDELGETDDDRGDHPQQIADPEAFVRQQRLKDIFEARREAREWGMKARATGDDKHKAAYLSAAKRFLLEIEPLLREFGFEEVWEDERIAEFEISPPAAEGESGVEVFASMVREDIGSGNVPVQRLYPDPQSTDVNRPTEAAAGADRYELDELTRKVVFDGLESLATAPQKVQETWYAESGSGIVGPGAYTGTVTREVMIPPSAVQAAIQSASRALARCGFRIEEDSEENTEITPALRDKVVEWADEVADK